MQVEGRRMLWRCRRGLLELDIVLARFITHHYEALEPDELQYFDQLLDYPDNDLWDLISGRKESQHVHEYEILQLIRSTRQPSQETHSPV